MYLIEVPEHIADTLDAFPLSVRGNRLERAINRALDASGWPNYNADTIAADVWYVTVWNRHGKLLGHVGPILGKGKGDAVSASWRKDGYFTEVTRREVGVALTNARS